LKEEQENNKKLEQAEQDLEAEILYEAFMDYHRTENNYPKPEWKDAVESDKNHFYHMADFIRNFGETSDEY